MPSNRCWNKYSSAYHVYKSVWTPELNEVLKVKHDEREEALEIDKQALGVYNSVVVGHVRWQDNSPLDNCPPDNAPPPPPTNCPLDNSPPGQFPPRIIAPWTIPPEQFPPRIIFKKWYNSGVILEMYHKVIIWMKNIFFLPIFIGNGGKDCARHFTWLISHFYMIYHLSFITNTTMDY